MLLAENVILILNWESNYQNLATNIAKKSLEVLH